MDTVDSGGMIRTPSPMIASSDGASGGGTAAESSNVSLSGTTESESRQTSWALVDLLDALQERDQQIRQMEMELAQTKLALVETQCQNQDLAHQVGFIMFCNSLHICTHIVEY